MCFVDLLVGLHHDDSGGVPTDCYPSLRMRLEYHGLRNADYLGLCSALRNQRLRLMYLGRNVLPTVCLSCDLYCTSIYHIDVRASRSYDFYVLVQIFSPEYYVCDHLFHYLKLDSFGATSK